jgi:hypothetical protein
VLVELEFLATQQEIMALIQYLTLSLPQVVVEVEMMMLQVLVQLVALAAAVVHTTHHLQAVLVIPHQPHQAKVITGELEITLEPLVVVALGQ